jgi:hypothetical protein
MKATGAKRLQELETENQPPEEAAGSEERRVANNRARHPAST